ncbi:MAG: hypothetical protein K8T10_01300 [Candidatus Eremiobacteraeota bacterium]|nr:hypothetical protein [Candidatus Eremiobacteraeota bacterium]
MEARGRITDLVSCFSIPTSIEVAEVFKPPMRITPGFIRGNERKPPPFTTPATSVASLIRKKGKRRTDYGLWITENGDEDN